MILSAPEQMVGESTDLRMVDSSVVANWPSTFVILGLYILFHYIIYK